jgi:hypothetical protein
MDNTAVQQLRDKSRRLQNEGEEDIIQKLAAARVSASPKSPGAVTIIGVISCSVNFKQISILLNINIFLKDGNKS